jgi:hypothetical protein
MFHVFGSPNPIFSTQPQLHALQFSETYPHKWQGFHVYNCIMPEWFAEGFHDTCNWYSHLACYPDSKNSNLFFLVFKNTKFKVQATEKRKTSLCAVQPKQIPSTCTKVFIKLVSLSPALC